MTTYSISFDDVELALLPPRSYPYNDFLKKEYFEYQVIEKAVEESPIVFYTCHICALEVPAAFASEHTASTKHHANTRIASVAALRMRALITALPPPAAERPNARFCANCATIADGHHELTKEHSIAVKHDEILWNLMKVYVNGHSNEENGDEYTKIETKNHDDAENLRNSSNNDTIHDYDKGNENRQIDNKTGDISAKNSDENAEDDVCEATYLFIETTSTQYADTCGKTEVDDNLASQRESEVKNCVFNNIKSDSKDEKPELGELNETDKNINDNNEARDTKFDEKRAVNISNCVTNDNNNKIGNVAELCGTHIPKYINSTNTGDIYDSIIGNRAIMLTTSRVYNTGSQVNRVINKKVNRQVKKEIVTEVKRKLAKQLFEKHSQEPYLKVVQKVIDVNNFDQGIKELDGNIQIERGNEIIHVPMDHFHSFKDITNGRLKCLVCMSKFENEYAEIHKYELDHIYKVAKVGDSRDCVRKMSNTKNHCIICNIRVKNKQTTKHVLSSQHVLNINNCMTTRTTADAMNKEIVRFETGNENFKKDEGHQPEIQSFGTSNHKSDNESKLVESNETDKHANENNGSFNEATSLLQSTTVQSVYAKVNMNVKKESVTEVKQKMAKQLFQKHAQEPYFKLLLKIIGVNNFDEGIKELDGNIQIERGNEIIHVPMDHFHSFKGIKNGKIKCLVCMLIFENEDAEIHKYELDHMNIVAKAGDNRHCVRQVSKKNSHCIICNIRVKNIRTTRHLLSPQHALNINNCITSTTTTADAMNKEVVRFEIGKEDVKKDDAHEGEKQSHVSSNHKSDNEFGLEESNGTDKNANGNNEAFNEATCLLESTTLQNVNISAKFNEKSALNIQNCAINDKNQNDNGVVELNSKIKDNDDSITRKKADLPTTTRWYKMGTHAKELINEEINLHVRKEFVPEVKKKMARHLFEKYAQEPYLKVLQKVIIYNIDAGIKEVDGIIQIERRNEIINVPWHYFHSYLECVNGNIWCIVCNTMFPKENAEVHKYELDHMSKVATVDGSKHCMRKITKAKSHCIICNIHIKTRKATAHVLTAQHIQNKNNCTTTVYAVKNI